MIYNIIQTPLERQSAVLWNFNRFHFQSYLYFSRNRHK